MPTFTRFFLAPALAFLLAAPPPPSPLKAASAGTAGVGAAGSGEGPVTLKDRVLAIVDEDPILASDVQRILALGLVQPNPGESDRELRRRVLAQLIDDRLRFHEIDRFGFEQVPVDEIEKNVAEIRKRFPSDEAFRQKLRELGLTPQALRQVVARQLMVMTHVEEQLGPRVFVSLDDIKAYYDKVLTPEMQKRKQPVPPLDEVRDQIRGVLREQRLNEALGKWTQELRQKADVQVYFDQPAGKLPPVVKKIEKKQ
jgi:parvulin-like peptidyl-prolyl isomerase